MLKKRYPIIGCCGLECGLCPRFYTVGTSRCPGCCGDNFELKHPACSFVNCCTKKHRLEICAECTAFPCDKFDHETGETDSYITHRKVMRNLLRIKADGIASLLQEEEQRMAFLQTVLQEYADGGSKNFLLSGSSAAFSRKPE